MVEAYEKLGLDDLAADARRVLVASFPDHQRQQKSSKSWWNPL
jgi:outer membrane protein assembly factor BamD (BamD/ComL family)